MSTLTKPSPSKTDGMRAKAARLESLRRSIERATHFLPAQGPITAFVHHNTLHAFEELPFEEAVVKGGTSFGCHPYLPEEAYRDQFTRGRIRQEDIEAVLIEDLGDRGDELLGFLGTRFHLRMSMLAHPLRTGPVAELRWVVAETEALRRFREETPLAIKEKMIDSTRRWIMRDLRNGVAISPRDRRAKQIVDRLFERFDKPHLEQWDDSIWESYALNLLWTICRDGVLQTPRLEAGGFATSRHRDWLLDVTGLDSDELVNDLLIRFCAAYLDQVFSGWPMPDKSSFFDSFADQYGQAIGLGVQEPPQPTT